MPIGFLLLVRKRHFWSKEKGTIAASSEWLDDSILPFGMKTKEMG
jgi:hypothetical protein